MYMLIYVSLFLLVQNFINSTPPAITFFSEGMHQTLFKYQSSRYKNSFRRRKKPHMSSNCFIDWAFRQSVSIYVQVSPFMDHHCRRETCQRRLDLLDGVSILTHTWPLQAWHHIPPAITSTWIIYHFVFLVEFFTGCLASFLWEYRSTWSARRSLVSQPTENMGQLCNLFGGTWRRGALVGSLNWVIKVQYILYCINLMLAGCCTASVAERFR